MGKIEIDQTRCKGCGLCTTVCPAHVISLSDNFNNQGYTPAFVVSPEKCTGCSLCAELCPDVAIVAFK